MADKDDRPGGMLEIPDSLGRDIDRAAQGKCAPPPIEAFLSDTALTEIESATRAREAPVRAGSLIPISPAEAARRRTQHGAELPRMPAMRRVVPAPYQRPRVSGGSHGKTWQHVRAEQVREGDIVPGLGLVGREPEEQVIYATRAEVLGVRPRGPGDGPELGTVAGGKQVDFGDLAARVAVGTAIVVRGAGGAVKAYRPRDEVLVFRHGVSGG